MKNKEKLKVKLPRVGRVFLDKLKMGLPMELVEPHMQEMRRTLDAMCRDKQARKLSSQGKGFHRYFIPIAEDEGLQIEIDPYLPKDKRYGVKIEWNPSRFGKRARGEIKLALRQFLGTRAELFLAEAAVLAVDTTCDYAVNINDVVIDVMDVTTTVSYGRIYNGATELESVYCGSKNSPRYVLGYDKITQLLDQWSAAGKKEKKKLTRLLSILDPQSPRMRLEEHREFGSEGLPLWKLDAFPVPFQGVHIYAFANAQKLMKTPLQRQTLELAKYAGLIVAFKGLEKNEIATMRRRLMKAQVEWWKPEVFVDAVKRELIRQGIFPDSSFNKRQL